jgi:transcription initiation factor IIE alpha subunit
MIKENFMENPIKLSNVYGLFHCEDCQTTQRWSYTDLVELGTPICPVCGEDMELTLDKITRGYREEVEV